MAHQRVRKSSALNSSSKEDDSQFAPRPVATHAEQNSGTPPCQDTQEGTENEAFNQNKFEVVGLQLKEKSGTITPVEQKRLGVLQAKVDGFLSRRVERASRFGHNFADLSHYGMPLSSGDPPVVQRMPLSTDRLNVAGEDHNESNARREREEILTKAVTAGGYWAENEFTVNVEDAEVEADPNSYRFLRALQVVARFCKILAESRLPPRLIPRQAKRTLAGGLPLIELAEREWALTKNVPYPGIDNAPLPPNKLAIRDRLMAERFGNLQKLKEALRDLDAMDERALDEKAVQERYQELKEARVKMVEKLMLTPELDWLRSRAMHLAAQASVGTIGLWKIGESHVSDILGKMPEEDDPIYNLMTQDQFNEEFGRLDLEEVMGSLAEEFPALSSLLGTFNPNKKPNTQQVNELVDKLSSLPVKTFANVTRVIKHLMPSAIEEYALVVSREVRLKKLLKTFDPKKKPTSQQVNELVDELAILPEHMFDEIAEKLDQYVGSTISEYVIETVGRIHS